MSDIPQIPDGDGDDDRTGFGGFFGASGGMPDFGAGFDLNALMRMLASDGPVNWEVAGQVAAAVAFGDANGDITAFIGGASPRDPAIDATTVDALLEVADIARTQVAAITGITEILEVPVQVIGRRAWADLHLDALKPVLEAFGSQIGAAMQAPPGFESERDIAGSELGGFAAFAGMLPMIGPLLLGMQAGSMVGELAKHALGRYELPLPTSDSPSIVLCAPNLDAFIEAWSLEARDTRFQVALFETVRAAVRKVPWVQPRLVRLATAYVSGYELDPRRMQDAFGDVDHEALAAGMLDPSTMDESAFAGFAADPQALLGAMRTDRQRAVLDDLQAFFAVLEGYTDTVCDRIGRTLIPAFDRIEEARRRHRLERGDADRFIEGLLGLELAREHYERGEQFCAGVVERAGMDGLNRLWEGEHMLPTRAELDAPGLWLARIELPEDAGA